jgi:lipopolysaccharide transport system ATP-binding protein
MRKLEIDRKFDEIVEFSGARGFLDTPISATAAGCGAARLRRRSPGPELLIIDESWRSATPGLKCLGKCGTWRPEAGTVLFVSHNMAAVESLCSRGVWSPTEG